MVTFSFSYVFPMLQLLDLLQPLQPLQLIELLELLRLFLYRERLIDGFTN